MSALLRAFRRNDRGAIAVEFAIIGPLLMIALVPVIDLGVGFYRNMQVQSAAQRAAVYATVRGYDPAAIAQVIETSRGGVSAYPSPRQFCACPGSSGLTEVTCSATCSLPGASFSPGAYVLASARATYRPIFPYPLVGAAKVLQASQVVRIR